MYVWLPSETRRGCTISPVELELQAVESCPESVLGTEFSPLEESELLITVESSLQPPY